ncbi:MAG: YggS family pyridoxal phosphate-dependent enzyme [Acidimicrobiaceae bacterium]|nr:YggS family pyridoxal phosphate-dependent enzyme [Acidimicrobiaceae bacterium]MDP6481182.1 YggS family pyridoxal phosphate-dependent enzyme [Acidimicrobiales bacterium]MDP6697132.1 YggS family pyridoxal phosphate-dependent enzyme [Acidimicrobiales bacterium]
MSPESRSDPAVPPASQILDRIGAVQGHLDARSGGRTRLLPVTKAFPVEVVSSVLAAGFRDVGENYAQELLEKNRQLSPEQIGWHMIGGLQRNKVRHLAGIVKLWQTVDRASLLDEIARRDPGARVLVQVDPLDGVGKAGCAPSEVEALVVRGVELGLDVAGLMTVGAAGDPGATRRAFSVLAGLADSLDLAERSMGMTDDMDLAVDMGSTLVRVGRAIFGERQPR